MVLNEKNQKYFNEKRTEWIGRVNPVDLLPHLVEVFTPDDSQRLMTKTQQYGNSYGMMELLDMYERKARNLDPLFDALRKAKYLDEGTTKFNPNMAISNVGSNFAIGSNVTSTVDSANSGDGGLWGLSSSSTANSPEREIIQQNARITVGLYYFQASQTCRIGHGAFGKVYKGRKTESEFDEVAIKIVDFPENQDNRKLLVMLSNLVGKEHENIVQYLQVTVENQNMYIVTELCQTDLEKIIKGGRRNLAYLHSIARQLAEGYHALYHDYAIPFEGRPRRIIHRDIKPANLFINHWGPDFILKIGDFGCSELVRQEYSYHYGQSGDAYYWAPEIGNPSNRDRPRGNHKVDIWSMAVVILEAALGKHPISRIADVQEGYEVPIPEDFVINIESDSEKRCREQLREMLQKMLKYDYHDRASIDDFHRHSFIRNEIVEGNESESE